MLGIRYVKAAPTTYLIQYSGGRIKREGRGLSFLYVERTVTLVGVPVGSQDVPFIFNELTADFQQVSVQGQLTYRVVDAKKLAQLLDYSLAPNGSYRSDDPNLLSERLVREAQIHARLVTQRTPLREALRASDALVTEILAGLRASEFVGSLGAEVLGLSIVAVTPTPDMAKALEAEAREQLQREADGAIYDRRNAAVEQERRIKESELNTEIAVEQKRRAIRETQMAADVAVEEQRTALIDRKVENDRKDADSRAYALTVALAPVRDMDWKTLMAATAGGSDPRLQVAVAFRELAENATKLGELNVTPDLLRSLLQES